MTRSPRQATCFYDARRLDLAVTAYAKAIERDSTRPQGFHGFGVCHQMMGSIQVAKEAYERALMLNPDSPGALSNLSVISANLGDYPLAIEQMSKSIVLAPDDPGSIIQLQYFKRHVCDWSNPLTPEISNVIAMRPGRPYLLSGIAADRQSFSSTATRKTMGATLQGWYSQKFNAL